jgi:hypothetical protein
VDALSCAWCSHEILDKRRKRFCSKECHQAAYAHADWDTERVDQIHSHVCEYCHRDFFTDRAIGKRGKLRFCSRDCSSLSKRNDQHRTCVVCGKRFPVPRIRKANSLSVRQTCSRECWLRYAKPTNEYVRAKRDGDYPALLALLKRDSVPQRVSEFMDEDCWIWQKMRDTHGYAVSPQALRQSMIRCIVEMRLGAKLGSQRAHHTCGCGALGCVRPSHLVPVTQAANVAEMSTRQALESRVKELTAALKEAAPKHPLLHLIPVVRD